MVPYTNSSQGRNSYHSGKRDDHYRDNYRHRDDDKYRRNSDRYPIVDSHKRREYSSNIIYDGRSSPSSRPTHKDWSRKSPPNAKLNNLKNELGRFKVYKNADNFNIGDQVGEGTYGQVFKAKESQSNIHVALKKLYISEDDKGKEKNRDGFPITAIREIEILRSLKHPNIVELKAMISVAKENYGMDMYMVFEYMDHDLTGILNNSGVVFRVPHIKCLGKQLFKGLEYLHKQQIIHRDIKGANLLLNNQGYLKICDFGLARRLHLDKTTGEPMPNYEYTNRVVTLWYRSPELLLGSTHYSFEVDIWSAGYILLIRCILLEFYVRQAVFRGNTEIQQLGEIFKFCGTPTDENWPSLINLPWTNLVNFEYKERILRKHFSDPSFGLSKEFINLLDALLMLDPSKRPDASLALAHRYFTAEEPFACDAKALPGIEGDWHEYQGKQRQKNAINNPNAKSPDIEASQSEIDSVKDQKRSNPYKRDSDPIGESAKRPRLDSATPVESKRVQLPSNPEDTRLFHKMYTKQRNN